MSMNAYLQKQGLRCKSRSMLEYSRIIEGHKFDGGIQCALLFSERSLDSLSLIVDHQLGILRRPLFQYREEFVPQRFLEITGRGGRSELEHGLAESAIAKCIRCRDSLTSIIIDMSVSRRVPAVKVLLWRLASRAAMLSTPES